ncbi:MAG: hypothetical protein ACK5OX_18435 [Desertimonas sp.]
MPTDRHDIEHLVAMYGDWLEHEFDLDVRPGKHADHAGHAGRRPGRSVRWRHLAAATIVAAVAGALVTVVVRSDDRTSIATPGPAVTVVHRAAIGLGDDQLNGNLCDTCEPVVYVAPLLLDNGDLVIPDTVARRWAIVHEGVPSIVPFGSWDLVAPPISDGVSVFAATRDGRGISVLKFDGGDLSRPAQTAPVEVATFSPLQATGGGITAAGAPLPGLTSDTSASPITATIHHDADVASVVVDDGVHTRRTAFPAGWTLEPPDQQTLRVLDDGTVIVIARTDEDTMVVEIPPAGEAIATTLPALAPLPLSTSEAGLVTLTATNDQMIDILVVPLPRDRPGVTLPGVVTSSD